MASLFPKLRLGGGTEVKDEKRKRCRSVKIPFLVLAAGLVARLSGRLLRKKRDIRGEVVLITGASRGIGARMAENFALENCKLCLAARSSGELEKVAEVCRKAGARAVVCVVCDVRDVSQLASLVDQCKTSLGPPDTLINNAGVEFIHPHHQIGIQQLCTLSSVNFQAPMLLANLVLPDMLSRKRGVICNISSFAGLSSLPYFASYQASKWGLNGFTLGLRQELKGTGVSCFAVCPSIVSGFGMVEDVLDVKKANLVQKSFFTEGDKLVRTVVAHVRMGGPNPLVVASRVPATPIASALLLFPCTTLAVSNAVFPLRGWLEDMVQQRSQGSMLSAEEKHTRIAEWEVLGEK